MSEQRIEQPALADERPLMEGLSALWMNMRAAVSDSVDLVALETRRAGLNAAFMIAASVVAALLAVTAWLALAAAVVLWFVDRGASWAMALFGCALVNLVGGVALTVLIRTMSRRLLFPATRRQLRAGLHTANPHE